MKTRQLRVVLAGALAIAALLSGRLIAGKVGTITTQSGQQFSGDITERADEITISHNGIDTIIPRSEIAAIEYTTLDERFQDAMGKLKADDIPGRIALARKSFDQNRLELAQQAIDSALEIDPLDRSARELSAYIGQQQRLQKLSDDAAKSPDRADARTPGTQPAARPARRADKLDRLTDEQVDELRRRELRPGDRVPIQFRNNVRRRYVDSVAGLNYRAFIALSQAEQAQAIMAAKDLTLAGDVVLRSDPPAISGFSKSIHIAVVQGCATSGCHASDRAGSLRLVPGNDPATIHTNFYLLNTYQQKNTEPDQGVFGASSRLMIDRLKPADSILIQFGLPKSKAKLPHPPVKGYDGLWREPMVKTISDWIQYDLTAIAPAYDIDFRPSWAVTQPATMPVDSDPKKP